jgi:hypothetical protein
MHHIQSRKNVFSLLISVSVFPADSSLAMKHRRCFSRMLGGSMLAHLTVTQQSRPLQTSSQEGRHSPPGMAQYCGLALSEAADVQENIENSLKLVGSYCRLLLLTGQTLIFLLQYIAHMWQQWTTSHTILHHRRIKILALFRSVTEEAVWRI